MSNKWRPIGALPAGTPEGTDIFYVIKDPEGTPLDRKITLSDLASFIGGGGGGGGIDGSIAANQIAVGTGADTIGGSPALTFASSILKLGSVAPVSSPNYTYPGATTIIGINSADYAENTIVSTSDGYAGAQTTYAFIARNGDVDASDGAALTAGQIAGIGGFWAQRENTTVANSGDIGFTLIGNPGGAYTFLANAAGDVGIGVVTSSFSGSPTPITTANLKIVGATGDATLLGDLQLSTGKALKTDTTTAHTALFQAYDVDGATYKTFATLTNANTPSLAIAAPSGGAVTIDGAVIGGTTPAAITVTTLLANVSSATALVVGPNGTTNPTLKVVTNTASGATGLSITNAASGSGVTLASLGGTNEDVIIDPKGTGKLVLVGPNTINGTKLRLDGSAFAGVTNAYIDFFLDTASGGSQQYASLGVNNVVRTAGAQTGLVRFSIYNAGSDDTTLSMLGRKVGIGLNTPTYALHIAPSDGQTAAQTVFVQDATATTGQTKMILKGGAVAGTIFEVQNSSATANVTITDAGLLKSVGLYASGDVSGIASTTGLTNATDTTVTNAYAVKGGQAATTANTGWVKIYIGTTVAWVPYWANATP